MEREELQTYLFDKYPDLIQRVNPCQRQLTVCDVGIEILTHWYIDEQEGTGPIEPRLLMALEDAKKMIEHSIAKIKGELE